MRGVAAAIVVVGAGIAACAHHAPVAPTVQPAARCAVEHPAPVLRYGGGHMDRNLPPAGKLGGPQTGLSVPLDLAIRSGELYVLDQRAVAVFGLGDTGNTAPRRHLVLPMGGQQFGLGLDSAGKLYVTTDEYPEVVTESWRRLLGAVRVYATDADGLATPLRVLAGPATHLYQPTDIGFDRSGDMYVTNAGPEGGGLVTIYAANAEGDAAPQRILAGPHTGLRLPVSLAFGPDDTLYVLNAYSWNKFGTSDVTVTVYVPGANGDAAPVRTLVVTHGPTSQGSRHSLHEPHGLAVDGQGVVYVADGWAGAVAFYPTGAAGDVAPIGLLTPCPEWLKPWGLALDGRGSLYVTTLVHPPGF
jgi:sugar lactone lactonase YvrE